MKPKWRTVGPSAKNLKNSSDDWPSTACRPGSSRLPGAAAHAPGDTLPPRLPQPAGFEGYRCRLVQRDTDVTPHYIPMLSHPYRVYVWGNVVAAPSHTDRGRDWGREQRRMRGRVCVYSSCGKVTAASDWVYCGRTPVMWGRGLVPHCEPKAAKTGSSIIEIPPSPRPPARFSVKPPGNTPCMAALRPWLAPRREHRPRQLVRH